MPRVKIWQIPQDIELLRVSRQRKLQILWARMQRCMRCGQPRQEGLKNFCLVHAIAQNEEQRRRNGAKRRNRGKTARMQEARAREALRAQDAGGEND